MPLKLNTFTSLTATMLESNRMLMMKEYLLRYLHLDMNFFIHWRCLSVPPSCLNNTCGVLNRLNQEHRSLLCGQFVYNDWALDLSTSCIHTLLHSAFYQAQCSNRHGIIWTGCGHRHYHEHDLIYISVPLRDCSAQQHLKPNSQHFSQYDLLQSCAGCFACVVSPWYPLLTP